MDDKKKLNKGIAKFGLVSGIVMIICGIIITVVSIFDIEIRSFWRIFSGVCFIILGTVYWITNSRALKK